MRILLLLGFASWSVWGQPISIGVKGGLPITDALETVQGFNSPFSSTYVANNHRYLVGGTVQLNLPARFSIEVDVLYRRLGYQQSTLTPVPLIAPSTTVSTTANSWEFPVLGKLALLPGPIRPFVDAGANFRLAKTDFPPGLLELGHDFTAGLTFGGGVEFKLGRMRFSPEFRYTHWGTENFSDPVNSLLHTNLNQGDFIVGITF
jgi:opacity protein-like surface antigen